MPAYKSGGIGPRPGCRTIPPCFGWTRKPCLSFLCAQTAPFPPLFRTCGPLLALARPVFHRPLGRKVGVMRYRHYHLVRRPAVKVLDQNPRPDCGRRAPESNRAGSSRIPLLLTRRSGPLLVRPIPLFWLARPVPFAVHVSAAAHNTFPICDPERVCALLRVFLLFLHRLPFCSLPSLSFCAPLGAREAASPSIAHSSGRRHRPP